MFYIKIPARFLTDKPDTKQAVLDALGKWHLVGFAFSDEDLKRHVTFEEGPAPESVKEGQDG